MMGVVFLSAAFSSCGSLEYESFTNDIYNEQVGNQFRTIETVTLSGIRGRDNVLDYFLMSIPPGYSGAEIGIRLDLPPSEIFEVTGFERCVSCSKEQLRLVVKFLANDSFREYKLVISTNLSGIVSLDSTGQLVFRDDLLERL